MSAAEYNYFYHDGFKLAFRQAGEGQGNTVLLIHGFAASIVVNWTALLWFECLTEAGYHVVAFDNRGHGLSDKSYKEADYAPELMAGDAVAFLDYLGVKKAHIMGYSMGGKLAAYMAMQAPERVQSAVLGGVGTNILTESEDWISIRDALLVPDAADIVNETGRKFREFVDLNKNDRRALAACVSNFKRIVTPEQLQRVVMPALVAAGSEDELIGAAQPLADLLPRGETLIVPGCSHLAAIGSKIYRKGVLDFFAKYPF